MRQLSDSDLIVLLGNIRITDTVERLVRRLPLGDEDRQWIAKETADAFRDSLRVLETRWTTPPDKPAEVEAQDQPDLATIIFPPKG